MKRRAGEAILIGDDMEIRIEHIGRTRVRVAINAPRGVPVVAAEAKIVGEENRAAAHGGTVAGLLANAGSPALAHVLAERLSPSRKT